MAVVILQHFRRQAAANRWLLPAVGGLMCLILTAPAWGQPCITCRSERCPTKADVKAWCGTGRDPLLPQHPVAAPGLVRQTIRLDSEPAGATVRLGGPKGDILGVTPIKEVSLGQGHYRLWLTLPGYQAAALEIDVQPRGERQFFATLQTLAPPEALSKPESGSAAAPPLVPGALAKEPEGRLFVRSNREGAEVRIDGKLVGTTPLPELHLELGPHNVSGRESGQDVSHSVDLPPKELMLVTLKFPVRRWVWVVTGVGAAAVAGLAIGLGSYYGTSIPKPDATLGGWR